MSKVSTKTELTAAEIAAADLFMAIDASAGTSGTKRLKAMAAALGLSKLSFFEDTGGDDAFVISTGLSLASLTAGFAFALKVTTGNTGACTLTVDEVAAKSIKVVDASGVRDPLTGEIAAGMTALLSYNGTYFILMNPAVRVKKYVALLTQSGTSAPVATVLENTLSGTPVWSRGSTGQYVLTLASEFPAGKVLASIKTTRTTHFLWIEPGYKVQYLEFKRNNVNSLSLSCQDIPDVSDGAASATPIDLSTSIWATEELLVSVAVYP